MKVKVSETNMPKWGNVTVKFDVPEKLEALQEMSKNIFWTWTSEATDLFKDIDAEYCRFDIADPCRREDYRSARDGSAQYGG